jgi:Tol biopolymer transport system component
MPRLFCGSLLLFLLISGFNLPGSNVLLISSNYTGRATGNGPSAELAVTPDGRYVAFTSYAADLGGIDTNFSSDVYLLDRVTGVRDCISTGWLPPPPSLTNPAAQNPVITPDGRFVAFRANYAAWMPYPPSRPWNFFVWDTVMNRYFLGSPNGNDRTAFLEGVSDATLSDDGRYSSFITGGADTDYYRGDLEAGSSAQVNVDVNGNRVFISNARVVTPDHRYFVFASNASNVVADPPKTNQTQQVYCRDMAFGTTRLVSVATNGGYASRNCFARAISPDGRYIAFRSSATNLQAQMGGGEFPDMFIRDMVANETWCASADPSGTGSLRYTGGLQAQHFSRDGSRFLFHAAWPGASGALYLHDVKSRTNMQLAANLVIAEGTGLSDNGRYALFCDSFLNLLSIDVTTMRTQRVARLAGWAPLLSAVRVSADGRWTFFVSRTNEVTGVLDRNNDFDVFAAPTISSRIGSIAGSGPRTVQGTVFPNDNVQLQRSSDLVIWDTVASGQASEAGTITLQENGPANSNAFYRLQSP